MFILETLSSLDARLTALGNSAGGHAPWLDGVMIATSQLALPLMVAAIASFWWLGASRQNDRRLVLQAGAAAATALLINQAILLLVTRLRPYDAGVSQLLVTKSADPSFPSDHAAVAFALAFMFWFSGAARRAVVPLFATAILIGYARVFVGLHYAGDVVGGVSTALCAALLVHRLYPSDTPLERAVIALL